MGKIVHLLGLFHLVVAVVALAVGLELLVVLVVVDLFLLLEVLELHFKDLKAEMEMERMVHQGLEQVVVVLEELGKILPVTIKVGLVELAFPLQ
jgi:hypothetical protein